LVRDFAVEREMKSVMLLLLSALAVGAAFAQSEGKKDPMKPDASVPAVTYRSAFEDYRPYRDQEVAPWRELNEEVARAGGHRGHAKPAPSGQAAEAAKPAPQPEPSQHGGHR